MRGAAVILALLWTSVANAQTRCQTAEVDVAETTVDLRLIACDPRPEARGPRPGEVVVYVCDTGVMQNHD